MQRSPARKQQTSRPGSNQLIYYCDAPVPHYGNSRTTREGESPQQRGAGVKTNDGQDELVHEEWSARRGVEHGDDTNNRGE